MDKELRNRIRGVSAQVDEILWKIWDPIGVQDYPQARDEYASYVGPIVTLLFRDAGVDEIVAHLAQIERVQMGVDGGDDVRLKAAVRLKAISLA